MQHPTLLRRIAGPAFLMATAAIGPGFITQTTVFTGRLSTSFAFAIGISIVLDIVVQLNIWRIVLHSGQRAPVLVNRVVPGAGMVLALLIAVGGLFFNMGNLAGAGLALQGLSSMPLAAGAVLSGVLAAAIFAVRSFGSAMDAFVKLAGLLMIGLLLYMVWAAAPPWAAIGRHALLPERVEPLAILTIVGGTVGGYISFAGAHRLLETQGQAQGKRSVAGWGAVSGILLASAMRVLLFAVVAGALAAGLVLPAENPAAAVFSFFMGRAGQVIFCIILWAASVTSVIAAAYTSISFLQDAVPWVARHRSWAIMGFILLSLLLLLLVGQPTALLVLAGTANGLVLPLALALLLVAASRGTLPMGSQHPLWLKASGWLVVLLLAAFGAYGIVQYVAT